MMNTFALIFHQIMYENKTFWRTPASAFFTFAFPLIFLFLLNGIFGDNLIESPYGVIRLSTFFIPAIIALSVISSCYTNLAIRITFARDVGVLRRIQASPIPSWIYFLGKILHTVLISILLISIILGTGYILFDVNLPLSNIHLFIIIIILGSATFSTLGIALTSLIPNMDAAPAIVNASILPLFFISDIFFPIYNAPKFITTIANIFPVKAFSSLLQSTFINSTESSINLNSFYLFILLLWLVIGLIIALRYFSWKESL